VFVFVRACARARVYVCVCVYVCVHARDRAHLNVCIIMPIFCSYIGIGLGVVFNFVNYVFVLLYLCILIVTYVLFFSVYSA